MRTFRLTLVGTVLLALLGMFSSVVLAQDEEAESGDASEFPVLVTGTESCGSQTSGETTQAPNGAESHRDLVGRCINTMSDARVSGIYTNTFKLSVFRPQQRVSRRGLHLLGNSRARWSRRGLGLHMEGHR